MFEISQTENGFELRAGGKLILRHSCAHPALFLGSGREKITMYRGNFTVEDRLERRLPLRFETFDGEKLIFAIPGGIEK